MYKIGDTVKFKCESCYGTGKVVELPNNTRASGFYKLSAVDVQGIGFFWEDNRTYTCDPRGGLTGLMCRWVLIEEVRELIPNKTPKGNKII